MNFFTEYSFLVLLILAFSLPFLTEIIQGWRNRPEDEDDPTS